jgi:glycosyltransferase involved in cell wall biosynthesis
LAGWVTKDGEYWVEFLNPLKTRYDVNSWKVMKTIGIIHYKVGGTDGVSLEIDKWKQVLEELGHRVHLCAGDLGRVEGTLIEEMFHHREEVERLNYNTFTRLRDYDEMAYRAEICGLANVLERKLLKFIVEKNIDFLIPHNVWSVAIHPPVAIALARVMRARGVPTLAHNHDFYWERMGRVALTCGTAISIADKYLPPRDPLIQHTVINSLAQAELSARKGIDAMVIPNVFDFDAPQWQMDDFNQDFRTNIGLGRDDVMVLQATRIVPRKGIELAIDFVQALDSPDGRSVLERQRLYDGRTFSEKSRIVLVLAGYAQDDASGQYLNKLKRRIEQAGIDAIFIDDQVGSRRHVRDGRKIYSLWDTYIHADFVTYPSLWEGWGNQLLEAIRARLPFMIFEYPVYQADIKDKGLRAVSLGAEIEQYDEQGLARVAREVVNAAADEALAYLIDGGLRQQLVEHNYQVGRQHYSLDALRRYLSQLIPS